MQPVEGHKYLYRDKSGAIVNTDTNEYNNYVKLRSEKQKQRNEIDEIKKDIGLPSDWVIDKIISEAIYLPKNSWIVNSSRILKCSRYDII